MNKQIGIISKKIIKILNLEYDKEQPIYIGDANINHMMEEHPKDFEKYGMDLKEILENPTYLARNEKKKSIEFIKKYKVESDFVLVAVRVSSNNVHFARTMYVMSDEKVKKYFKHKYFYKF